MSSLPTSYFSKLSFVHLLGWIHILSLHGSVLGEQPSLEGSIPSTDQIEKTAIPLKQTRYRKIIKNQLTAAVTPITTENN
jgi:hypothetical protein